MRTSNKYDEILSLPHHVSKTRPQMPMSDRAAQFAPFAALTGYDSAIKETGRLTDERIELDEEALTALDLKYQLLMEALDEAPKVTITYFQPDERKAGGKYLTATGAVKKAVSYTHLDVYKRQEYATPEELFGYDLITSAYQRDPQESKERILKHLQSRLPNATKMQLENCLLYTSRCV